MRRVTLASLFALAAAVQAAELVPTVVPQPRPRLAPEIIATLATTQTAKAVPASAEAAEATTPVLTIAAATDPAARGRAGIVEMAPFVVEEPKIKVPSEYQMLTPKGRLEVALKKRPGLKFFNLWGLNNGLALAMMEEELALERRREMAELMSLYLIK